MSHDTPPVRHAASVGSWAVGLLAALPVATYSFGLFGVQTSEQVD